jgi:hypothetical protein
VRELLATQESRQGDAKNDLSYCCGSDPAWLSRGRNQGTRHSRLYRPAAAHKRQPAIPGADAANAEPAEKHLLAEKPRPSPATHTSGARSTLGTVALIVSNASGQNIPSRPNRLELRHDRASALVRLRPIASQGFLPTKEGSALASTIPSVPPIIF